MVLVRRAGLCLGELCRANPPWEEGASALLGSALQGLGPASTMLSITCARPTVRNGHGRGQDLL